jgi:hypothetical protein
MRIVLPVIFMVETFPKLVFGKGHGMIVETRTTARLNARFGWSSREIDNGREVNPYRVPLISCFPSRDLLDKGRVG